MRVKHSCRNNACLGDLGVHLPCDSLVNVVVCALPGHLACDCVPHVAIWRWYVIRIMDRDKGG